MFWSTNKRKRNTKSKTIIVQCPNIIIVLALLGVILKTEDITTQKGDFFTTKNEKGTPDLTSPYVYSLFKIVLMKQIFEKNK